MATVNYPLAAINSIDDLVKEYLLFRGFTQTIRILDSEKKNDKLKGYQADKIIEQMFFFINNYDIVSLVDLWNFLDTTFFSKLETDFSQTIRKLEVSLKRYYLIYATNSGRLDKVREFFEMYASELAKDAEWRGWFALPYLKNPQGDPSFEVFFSKVWVETFSLSLHNFLVTIVKSVPLPKLLSFDNERQVRKRLELQIDALKKENENLKNQIVALEDYFIRKNPRDESLEKEKRERDLALEKERKKKEKEDQEKERERDSDSESREPDQKSWQSESKPGSGREVMIGRKRSTHPNSSSGAEDTEPSPSPFPSPFPSPSPASPTSPTSPITTPFSQLTKLSSANRSAKELSTVSSPSPSPSTTLSPTNAPSSSSSSSLSSFSSANSSSSSISSISSTSSATTSKRKPTGISLFGSLASIGSSSSSSHTNGQTPTKHTSALSESDNSIDTSSDALASPATRVSLNTSAPGSLSSPTTSKPSRGNSPTQAYTSPSTTPAPSPTPTVSPPATPTSPHHSQFTTAPTPTLTTTPMLSVINNNNNNNNNNTNNTNNNNTTTTTNINTDYDGTQLQTQIAQQSQSQSQSQGQGGPPQKFETVAQDILWSHTSAVAKTRFSGLGSKMACSGVDGVVKIWSTDSTARITTIFCFAEVLSLEWETKTNKLLLCGTTDARVKVWNVFGDRDVGDIVTDQEFPRVEDLSCNPSGANFVAALSSARRDSGQLVLYNLKTFKIESKLTMSKTSTVTALNYNHNGSLVLAGSTDGMIRVFDMKTCTAIAGWQAHSHEVAAVQFSADETSVFSVGKDNKIIQWSVHSMAKVVREYAYPGFCRERPFLNGRIAFDSEGHHFVVPSLFNYAIIYHVDHSTPVSLVQGHSAPVIAVDWHPASDTILTGSMDLSVRVSTLARR